MKLKDVIFMLFMDNNDIFMIQRKHYEALYTFTNLNEDRRYSAR